MENSERGWTIHEYTAEEKEALLREMQKLKDKHPAPCELFLTTTGGYTCP